MRKGTASKILRLLASGVGLTAVGLFWMYELQTPVNAQGSTPTPTLQETVTFIKQGIENTAIRSFVLWEPPAMGYNDFSYGAVAAEGCLLTFRASVKHFVHYSGPGHSVPNPDENTTTEYLITFSLQHVVPESIHATTGADVAGHPISQVQISFDQPITVGDAKWTGNIFTVRDADLAPRLAKAFVYGAKLCGAKASLF